MFWVPKDGIEPGLSGVICLPAQQERSLIYFPSIDLYPFLLVFF